MRPGETRGLRAAPPRAVISAETDATAYLGRNHKIGPAVAGAMTHHVALAGSVFAGVALWAGVYVALLPTRGPDPAEPRTVSAVTRVSSAESAADREELSPGPRRWADLPRETAKRSSVLPVDADAPSAASLPDVGAQQADLPTRQRGRARIRAVARRDSPLARHLTRPHASRSARAFARARFRRVREPIQFSLATRSSS